MDETLTHIRATGDAIARYLTPTRVTSDAADPMMLPPKGIVGGRLSIDTLQDTGAFNYVLEPDDADATWRFGNLDVDTITKISPVRLVEMLADLSPDISRALWDFQRMFNPGWEATGMVGGTPDPTAQAAIDAFIDQLTFLYGDFNILIGRLSIAAFLRGAVMAELILAPDGRTPVDLATPDPASARFKRIKDPVRGPIWQLYQWQAGKQVPLDRPTVRYVPIDPLPGRPYGRAPAAPAVFTTIFLLAMLHDIRRVVQQQGYPRIDIEVMLDKLTAMMPENLDQDPKALQTWVDAVVGQVKTVYEGLQPDSAYIHTDVVKVNRPVGTVDASSLGGVNQLIDTLTRMLIRALKTMPLLMAISDRVSEANANRQWEIHVAGIKAVQHPTEVLLETMFGYALQAQGIRGRCKFRFAELRTAELLRDAQVMQLNILNAAAAYANGWISQDDAAFLALGRLKADEAEPRGPMKGATGPLMGTNPEPGGNRLSTDDILGVQELLDKAGLS